MPDYSLGRAHGKIEIDYDGSGANKAARDLDRVAAEAAATDTALSKTQRTVKDTSREFGSSGTAAQGYSARLREVRNASEAASRAERDYKAALLSSRSSADDIVAASDRLNAARRREAQATNSARDAHRAFSDTLGTGQRIVQSFSNILPNLHRNIDRLAKVEDGAADKSTKLARGLGAVAKGLALAGPEAEAAAGGFELASKAVDKMGSSAAAGGGHIRQFVSHIAGLELAVGKIGGLTLGGGALLGLGGLVGGASLQGITAMIDAVRQLSGTLGVLPAAIAGVGLSMGTLKIAFHGVGDAIKDMMADDPKKFLEDIKNMGPVAAQSMLQIAQFRNAFKLAGASIQDSFFRQIAADIQPLIQQWLPTITQGMSGLSEIFGKSADQFAKLLQQPQMMAAFEAFVNNIQSGLQALQPAMAPLLDIFTRLTVVGSGFFQQIGQDLTQIIGFFDNLLAKAQASGAFQNWIQNGINAFNQLVNVVYYAGSAFNTIFDVAEKFGGGGFLGWLQKITGQFDAWTKSVAGQNALQAFFSTTQQAMASFAPMIQPIATGLASLFGAIGKLGIGIAPGWQTFFNTFSQSMQQFSPILQSLAPTINQFLVKLSQSFAGLMSSVGPQIPTIFAALANAFEALLPQIQPLANAFVQLVEQVGPQVPTFFNAVTSLIIALMPYLPTLIGFIRDIVSAFTEVVSGAGSFADGLTALITKVGDLVLPVLSNMLHKLGESAMPIVTDMGMSAGKALVKGLASGLADATGLGFAKDMLGRVLHGLGDLLPKSPAKEGPFSGDGWTFVRGRKIVTDLAAGVTAAQPVMLSAARSVVGATSSALAVTGSTALSGTGAAAASSAGAPAAGGSNTTGMALLPDNIANADVSILTAYLRHQFDEARGLKGLAKTLGQGLQVMQGGFNLIQQQVIQPMFQAMGLTPAGKAQGWRKLTPAEQTQQMQDAITKDAATAGPTWADALGAGSPGAAGGPPSSSLDAALKAQGFSPEMSRLIQGFSQVEGNNPAGNPTLGFTDAQLGGATDLPAHVLALSKQIKDRAPVAGPFPAGGTDQEQAQWMAKVVGQAGLSSDWQGNAQPQDYVQRVVTAMRGITADGKGPTWQQVAPQPKSWFGTPITALSAAGTTGTAPTGSEYDSALLSNVPAGQYLQTQAADLTKGIADCSSAVEDLINIADGVATSGRQMSTANAAAWLTARGFTPTTTPVPGAFMVGFNDHHMQATLPGGTPFNWGSDAAAAQRGIGGTGAFDPAFTAHYYRMPSGPTPQAALGASGDPSGQMVMPNGKTLDELTANTDKSAAANNALLQAYLQGNPALATQIQAAQQPGAADADVKSALGGIGRSIEGLQQQDSVANKGTIDALRSTQSDIAKQQGFISTQNPIQATQSALSGVGNAITGGFQVVQGVLDAMAATQDIADRLVYGLRNSEDVNKIIDDVQSYISLAADVANETGNVLSTIGGIAGGAGGASGAPGGGSAGGALSLAGTIASLIGGALQGVNQAIDYGQQIYEISMGYVGKFMSFLTAGPGGTPLLGDVQYLLDTRTGQLLTSSLDNPGNQNSLGVPQFLQGLYGMGAYGSGSSGTPIRDVNFYAGPGQTPAQMMNEAMWMVDTGGVSNGVGALQAANF